ncbi:MAG: hypothetical protein L3J51_05945 [Cocleimonas sp.]|nr:hypothetical protein [Cocleimonas sp.]
MKNKLLTMSVLTLLLAGQSAIASSNDEEIIPVFENSAIVQATPQYSEKVQPKKVIYSTVKEQNNPYYNAKKDPYSLHFSSDK